jgi:hypothetical protein
VRGLRVGGEWGGVRSGPGEPHFQHVGIARPTTSITPLTGTVPPGSLAVSRFFRASLEVISRVTGP